MHKYWFRHRKFPNFGYTPISAEGWILTAVLVALIVILLFTNNFWGGEMGMRMMPPRGINLRELLSFIWQLIITIGLFAVIAEAKTEHTLGEKITTAFKRK
ncbi:MAG: hypothetical protein PHO48_02645 [Candidatus Gracilibacteria bacterium]|nr:hypothetical protein [Candidatus Gracilibacteria bacterium]MDD5179434.1 hypothetical protein [Candidatus Gracilibacteria bacterium]